VEAKKSMGGQCRGQTIVWAGAKIVNTPKNLSLNGGKKKEKSKNILDLENW